MNAYETVLDALDKHGATVRANGSRRWQCPAHPDRNPSLSLRAMETQALLYCHAGCATSDVLAALNLGMPDLFDNPNGARYDYTDLAGTVTRTVHRDPNKRFRQWGQTKGTADLFRLPQVLEAVATGDTIYLTEGEKDVLALESIGAVATTSPMGAANWHKIDPTPLTGAHVVVVPDLDTAGKAYAAAVVDSLRGLAASLRVALPKVGKDAADHVAAGYGLDDLVPVELAHDVSETQRRVVLTAASDFKIRRVEWLWERRIALGTLALLAGPEGVGKSTLGYWLAAQITRGLMPSEYTGRPRGVLVCASEDSWEHTITPRLVAHGADLTRVFRIEVEHHDGIHGELDLPRDLAATERAAIQVESALLILDPLMSRLSAKLDTHRDSDVRRALEPVAAVADRTGMGVLGLIHHNKSGSTNPLDLVMASKAFTAVARSVHSVIRDPDDETETRKLFGTPKNNLGRIDLPTMTFTIEGFCVPTEGGDAWTGKLVWGDDAEGTIGDAMRRAADQGDDRTATSEAEDWLHDWLTSLGGTDLSANVKKAAAAAGHKERPLRAARGRLKLKVTSDGSPRVSYWSLPTTDPVVTSSGDTTPGERSQLTRLTQLGDETAGQPSRDSRDSRDSGDTSPEPTSPLTPGGSSFDPRNPTLFADDDCPGCASPVAEPAAPGCVIADLHGGTT